MSAAPKYYSVSLPCKAYVRKYIEHRFGSPVPATNKTTLGNYINACLVKERYTEHQFTGSFIHRFDTKLTIMVSAWAFQNIGFDFPSGKIIEINRFMEARFEEHLFEWCQVRYLQGTNERRKLIEEFAETHGISLEEDISLDALVKTEYRMRLAIQRTQDKQKLKGRNLFS